MITESIKYLSKNKVKSNGRLEVEIALGKYELITWKNIFSKIFR